jgi:hypothetical protein
MIRFRKMNGQFSLPLYLAVLLLLLSGCAKKNVWSEGQKGVDEAAPENVPYYANDYNDIMVPSELSWDREGSMSIKTESYAGGVIKFVGRVEVNSVADFFVNTMVKNKWKLVGSAKYKNILLAFTKPNKTAMVMIYESDLSRKTSVYIYVTDDIAARQGYNPFVGETNR